MDSQNKILQLERRLIEVEARLEKYQKKNYQNILELQKCDQGILELVNRINIELNDSIRLALTSWNNSFRELANRVEITASAYSAVKNLWEKIESQSLASELGGQDDR